MSLVVVGLSHQTAPVEWRERFALPDNELPGALARLRDQGLANEAVIVSTCNRVEIYAATDLDPDRAGTSIEGFIRSVGGAESLPAGLLYRHAAPLSVEHLCRVACGLESMVLGETEILGQVKKAYELALRNGFTGRVLNRAFQRAFSIAKQVRSETQIQRGSTSIGSVAVELAEKLFSALDHCHVMVLGAGEMGEKTARALQSRGARSVLVSNRSYERAVALSHELGGRALHFDEWEGEFSVVDIIISSTSAPHYVLDRQKIERLMRCRPSRPLMLIDIAVPRDIDPKVELLENVYLYDIDDLQLIADDSIRQRREEVIRCEAIIRERIRGLV